MKMLKVVIPRFIVYLGLNFFFVIYFIKCFKLNKNAGFYSM